MPNYLYNGIELPALPDYDKTQYPYVYISRFYTYILDKWTYYVLFTSSPYYGYSSGKGEYCIGYRKGAITYYLNEGDATWGHQNTWDKDGVFTELNTLVWANFDVLNEDGSVYLAASDPVPISHYLYNGIELPALPDYDKTLYPYAVIMLHTGNKYSFVFSNVTMIIADTGYTLMHPEGINTKFYYGTTAYIRTGDENWGEIRYGEDNGYLGKAFWANYDLYDKNGNLYLPASDPVPVPGEPEEPDEPVTVLSWQKHDAYKPNTKWDGNTFYRVMGGKWVKQDEVSPSLVEDEPAGDPIAYLYNDVQLPDINGVWTDKVTYPYAMITRTITDGTCLLHVCGDMPYYTEQAHSTEGYEPTVIAPKPYKAFAHVDGSWVLNTEETDYGFSIHTGSFELIWTNVDVMNKDNGSVYFDASEPPVPVYA